MSVARQRVLEQVAALVRTARRVGIDGVDGAGKTVFADELAEVLRTQGSPVVRASVDGFHRPRAERYRRGRYSPEGYYLDSYDYPALRALLLDPFAPGTDRRYCSAIRDVATDAALPRRWRPTAPGVVLLLDGIFLQRPELAGCFEAIVYLQASLGQTYARMALRDGCSENPGDPANDRYLAGQRLYLAECSPAERASVVVDNTDLAAPVLVRSRRHVPERTGQRCVLTPASSRPTALAA